MSKRSKPKDRPSKRRSQDLGPGDPIIRARTAELLWRVVPAARATPWTPEMEGCDARTLRRSPETGRRYERATAAEGRDLPRQNPPFQE